MREKTKILKTFNIDIDASEKFKMICSEGKQSKRVNQLILDDIELHSDLILESDSIMLLKKKLGIISTRLKEKTKLLGDLSVEIPILEEDKNHVLSQIEKQRYIENKKNKEETK